MPHFLQLPTSITNFHSLTIVPATSTLRCPWKCQPSNQSDQEEKRFFDTPFPFSEALKRSLLNIARKQARRDRQPLPVTIRLSGFPLGHFPTLLDDIEALNDQWEAFHWELVLDLSELSKRKTEDAEDVLTTLSSLKRRRNSLSNQVSNPVSIRFLCRLPNNVAFLKKNPTVLEALSELTEAFDCGFRTHFLLSPTFAFDPYDPIVDLMDILPKTVRATFRPSVSLSVEKADNLSQPSLAKETKEGLLRWMAYRATQALKEGREHDPMQWEARFVLDSMKQSAQWVYQTTSWSQCFINAGRLTLDTDGNVLLCAGKKQKLGELKDDFTPLLDASDKVLIPIFEKRKPGCQACEIFPLCHGACIDFTSGERTNPTCEGLRTIYRTINDTFNAVFENSNEL